MSRRTTSITMSTQVRQREPQRTLGMPPGILAEATNIKGGERWLNQENVLRGTDP